MAIPSRPAAPARSALAVAVVCLVVAIAGCALGEAPAAPADDPELVEGRNVYIANCMSCHGTSGGGGRGPKLNDGAVVTRFPDPADQATLIIEGARAMPAFDAKLSPEQIGAVVRYTREVLAVTGAE
jgi:mono/diheme cytochrome c family protein